MSLEDKALRDIARIVPCHKNPLLTFSGGKDSLVLCHMVRVRLGMSLPIFSVVCVLFPEDEADVYQTAQRLGMAPVFHKELTPERLSQVHSQFLPPMKKANTRLYYHRHLPAIERHIRGNGHDLALFGRRLEENTVPAQYYRRQHHPCWSMHPLRAWRAEDIWGYIRAHDLWYPRCYQHGARQLRTWISFLIDAHAKDPGTCVAKLHERYPPAVEILGKFWPPATEYLNGH